MTRIQIPHTDSSAIQNALSQTLQKHKQSELDLQALSTSLTAKFALITEVVPDLVYNGSLSMCDEHSLDSNEHSLSDSTMDDESSIESDIDEDEELLDVEAWQKVEALRREVALTAKQVRDLRREVPQRSVYLAKRDMSQCLADKEASLNVLQSESVTNLNANEHPSSSLELTNMQRSLNKLSQFLKCGEDEVLTGEKIVKLQSTLDAVEVGLKKLNEENPTALDAAMMSVQDQDDDDENKENKGIRIEGHHKKSSGVDDPYDLLAQYITRY